MTFPIKADCDHGYCLDCLYTYWENSTWSNLCPLCRIPIQNIQLIEVTQISRNLKRKFIKNILEFSKNAHYILEYVLHLYIAG